MELYKKYRPTSLGEVFGNKATVKSLRQMIATDSVPKAILLHGPSGCGKTTLARILKESLGCSDFDYVEMNSSSFRGIDTIRDMIRAGSLSATGSCKVYLLDEVHQLTKDAQNAALKIWEDTPPRTYFILCTTDPQKLIPAVRSRCTELEVAPLKDEQMAELVSGVCKIEKIRLSQDVLDALLVNAEGSARRALVLLDKIRHLDDKEDRLEALAVNTGTASAEVLELCRALLANKGWQVISKLLRGIKEEPESVRWAVLGYMNSVLIKAANRRAYEIIASFSSPFYDNKQAGLTGSCFEVTNGG